MSPRLLFTHDHRGSGCKRVATVHVDVDNGLVPYPASNPGLQTRYSVAVEVRSEFTKRRLDDREVHVERVAAVVRVAPPNMPTLAQHAPDAGSVECHGVASIAAVG